MPANPLSARTPICAEPWRERVAAPFSVVRARFAVPAGYARYERVFGLRLARDGAC